VYTIKGVLVALTRLYYFRTLHLPPEPHLTAPPWLADGIDDYLASRSAGREQHRRHQLLLPRTPIPARSRNGGPKQIYP
jgi:hypothetical protein